MAKKGKGVESEDGGIEFFLRFYGATQEQIESCMQELLPYMEAVVEVRSAKLNRSCNVLVPAGNNTEVVFVFSSMEACSAFKAISATRDIYMKYASPAVQGKFVERGPGDLAFGDR